MVFVDWDNKGRATIDLSRALDSDSDDDSIIELADDSDDEHMSDDSDDDSYPGDEF